MKKMRDFDLKTVFGNRAAKVWQKAATHSTITVKGFELAINYSCTPNNYLYTFHPV